MYCYICHQQAAIALRIELDWPFFIFIFIVLILLLNWIHLFVLKLVEADSGGLAYKAGYVGHKYAIIAGMLEIQ